MVIIYCSQSLKDYSQNYRQIIEKRELFCPVCGGRIKYHGSYVRKPRFGTEKTEITILRGRCIGECKRTHALLPDFLSPHKHYSAVEIEMVLEDAQAGIHPHWIDSPADISTIQRWLNSYKQKAADAAAALEALLYQVYGIVESVVSSLPVFPLKRLEALLRKLPAIQSSGLLIGQTNIWLTSQRVDVFL